MSVLSPRPRLIVIGIDGVPYSLLRKLIESGVTPNIEHIVKQHTMIEQKSVLPTVSSAAWTSFMTGLHPSRHGISGFIIKDTDSYDVRIPDSSSIRGTTVQQLVSGLGHNVFSMGVPVTSPPFNINGIMIGCFLSPNLDHVVWPPEEITLLKQLGYCIDPDPRTAHTDRAQFLEMLVNSLNARFATIQHYIRRKPWDLFLAHVMETDRLHHFYWDDHLDETLPYHEAFFNFYRRLDSHIGHLLDDLGGCDDMIILSDHGFCRLDYEVNLARWLIEKGLCSVKSTGPGLPLAHIDWSVTRVYSLIPGRLYVNIQGREPRGIVKRESKRRLLEDVRDELLRWVAPDGEHVLEDVLIEEQIPGGALGFRAPDALLVPKNGMDLKDGIGSSSVFERKVLNGMHTYNDALLILPESLRETDGVWIGDMLPTILKRLCIPIPDHLDGRVLESENRTRV